MATIMFDWTIRITDLAMLVLVALSPFLAIWATEKLRHRKEARDRKLHIFRSLMMTRQALLAPSHVDALNLIDLEYDTKIDSDRAVIEAWKLYHTHLNKNVVEPNWGPKRLELLIELLHEMALYLKFPFDKSHIELSSYRPMGYGEIEEEQTKVRKAAIEVLTGRQPISIIAPQKSPVGSSPKQVNEPPSGPR